MENLPSWNSESYNYYPPDCCEGTPKYPKIYGFKTPQKWKFDEKWPDIEVKPDIPSEIKVNASSVPSRIEIQYVPPIPKLEWKVGFDGIQGTRNLIEDAIQELPEYRPCAGIPAWIGSPPHEAVEKVKHEVLKKLAYYEWEKAGKPEGRNEEFWAKAEQQFKDAFLYWF